MKLQIPQEFILRTSSIMKTPLWTPSPSIIENANITRFIQFVNKKHNLNLQNYNELHHWSTEYIEDFWSAVWKFGEIKASEEFTAVIDDMTKMPGAKWFPGAVLNFAENLLKHQDSCDALIFKSEMGHIKRISYSALYSEVSKLSQSLRDAGVSRGDRVVGYMPNIPETIISMLATTSLGAVWSSCGTGLGPKAVLERFEQIEPKILLTVDSYTYKGSSHDVITKATTVVNGIPSIRETVVFPYIRREFDSTSISNSILYDDFIDPYNGDKMQFEQVPFNHPLYIMFSSGTTGKPKCMVQSVGGVLIKHLSELLLHTDLKRSDIMLYNTSPSWMMWNWMVSSLAVGATVFLYDGNPNYPDWQEKWQLIQDEKISIFGCSATYLNYLKSINAQPGKDFNLSSLREISQTGSALSEEGFQYVYQNIKQDIHFNSISGGTDINGCFAAGSPIQPVYAGELQGPCLAMKVKAYNDEGTQVLDQKGELVCEAPAPSMPLYFWNDPANERYTQTYFTKFPNVWQHGDWIVIHSNTGGITFLGRSDFTLKPSGVRIGPSEIYNVVEELAEVADSVVVGQDWEDDQRILLFIKVTDGFNLTEELINRIKVELRKKAGPRHVPARIFSVPDIPYTFSMKKVESAVSNIVNNRPVTNRDAIRNPESLDVFFKIADGLEK
jgi:acetoacetyl-CoA synthetase